MTDLLEKAQRYAAGGYYFDAIQCLARYLRSTPTAPARTEEKRFVSGSHVYKHYGVEESPDAEGSEGPSEIGDGSSILPFRHQAQTLLDSLGSVIPGLDIDTTASFLAGIWSHGQTEGRSSAARELAELREKVRAYEAWLTKHGKEELYSAANELEGRHSGYDYGPRVAWLREAGVELDSVVKAHLRPGSGSDEGKA